MFAVIMRDVSRSTAQSLLADLRQELGRRPGDVLHWRNLKHSERVHVSQRLGTQRWLAISSVIVAKRHLTGTPLNDDQAYLYTFRYLLERLTWFARDAKFGLDYTLAHVIIRFQLPKLRQYEAALRNTPGCQVAWAVLGNRGGSLDQPSRIEELQLADISASATFNASEPDRFGNTETRYLQALAPRLYRRRTAPLTSYGLKIHPLTATTKGRRPVGGDLVNVRRPA